MESLGLVGNIYVYGLKEYSASMCVRVGPLIMTGWSLICWDPHQCTGIQVANQLASSFLGT